MEELLEIIEQIQIDRGNFVPRVATYGAIVRRWKRRPNLQELLNEAVLQNKLIWGEAPLGSVWFATKLSDDDRERIKEYEDYTIESDIN